MEPIQLICFGERGQRDPWIFGACLRFLMTLSKNQESQKFYKRMEPSTPMIEKCIEMFKKFFFYPKIHDFDYVAISTFDFLYRLCQTPDKLSENLLFILCQKIQQISNKIKAAAATTTTTDDGTTTMCLPVYILRRLLFVVGYVAMKEMVFLDIDVYNNMKYRQELTEEKKSLKKNMNNKRKTLANLNMSASNAIKRLSGTTAEPQQEVSYYYFYWYFLKNIFILPLIVRATCGW